MTAPTRILVVDDELVMRHLLDEILRADGFEVTTAADGAEGLRRFRIHPTDLVISDTHMPRMDGPAFWRALRNRRPRLPMIIMDSIPDESVAHDDGRTTRVNKPFALTEMRAAVSRFTRGTPMPSTE